MIAIDDEYAESKVYAVTTNKSFANVYLVKVSLTDIKMYITGIRVQPSPKHPERGLWVQLPAYPAKGRWVQPLEIASTSPLWELVESISRKAVEDYEATHDVIEDIDYENYPAQLDEAIKKLGIEDSSTSI